MSDPLAGRWDEPPTFLSDEEWEAHPDSKRFEALADPADREAIASLVQSMIERVALEVAASLPAAGARLTRPELEAYQLRRRAALDDARERAWSAVAELDGRCRHGAIRDACCVRNCAHQVRVTPAPSSERYASGELRRAVLERDGYRCHYCGRPVRDDLPADHPDKANVDHEIPYDSGGRTRIDNLVAACTGCNKEKGNALPRTFLEF